MKERRELTRAYYDALGYPEWVAPKSFTMADITIEESPVFGPWSGYPGLLLPDAIVDGKNHALIGMADGSVGVVWVPLDLVVAD